MTPSRPYLIRGIYEWISDNHLTPYIIVDAEKENVHVPKQYVKDGKIVFNIAHSIVKELDMSNTVIQFSARFSGVLMHIYAPINAVVAIYAKENGRGMFFQEEEIIDEEGGSRDFSSVEPASTPKKKSTSKKSHLRIVK